MLRTNYNPRTQEGLDLYDYARETAIRTGRLVFGQLWLSDPSLDDMVTAIYADAIAEEINRDTPLRAYFR